MFEFFKSSQKINTTKIIDEIENAVYTELKQFGFRKHGRTLHRFVENDISQAICFQCGQAYRHETHLMWVTVGIRVPECVTRSFSNEHNKKTYYHEYECNIRSCLGTVKGSKQSCYNLSKSTEKIIADILSQIKEYVLPAFEALNSRDAILNKRRGFKNFDIINGHLIFLEEAMMYGKAGDMAKASELFNRHYNNCLNKKRPNTAHIEYLRELARNLNIILDEKQG